jgi:hypothetical protein
MLHVDNCVLGGQLCDFICFVREVACRSTCDLGSPSPALISTAQQHVYLFVFVEVERGVRGLRGACYTSTTMFSGGQLCMFFVFMGEWLVAPCVAHARLFRLHIDSVAAYVCAYICRGGAGRVWAQGRMLHVDNHVFWWAVVHVFWFFVYVGE